MELATVKKHLRVDFDDDDELIQLEQAAAERYVTNAVGRYNDDDPLAQQLVLFLVGEMYNNRQYSISVNNKTAYTVRSMIVQLQRDEDGGDDE